MGLTRCSECRPANTSKVPGTIGSVVRVDMVTAEDSGDIVVVLVGRGANARAHLEVTAIVTVFDRERDHEVGLVEVPLQLVAVAHHREVQCAERIGVGVHRVEAEQRRDEAGQLGPLVEPADRGVGGEEVVRDRAERVGPEPLARMISGEGLVREPQVDGAEPTAAVRERCKPARVLDEHTERVCAHKPGNLARTGGRELGASRVDGGPVEIDHVVQGDAHGRRSYVSANGPHLSRFTPCEDAGTLAA